MTEIRDGGLTVVEKEPALFEKTTYSPLIDYFAVNFQNTAVGAYAGGCYDLY